MPVKSLVPDLSIKQFSKFITSHVGVILAGLVALCVLALYLSVAPDRLTNANFGGDGGDFLAAILTRGIPHPTGYPTYLLLGRALQSVPMSTAVFRAILASLLPAALGAGLLTAWVQFVSGSRSIPHLGAAILAGFAWGVAPLFFSQAVIVEVHGLQSLFSVLILWWVTLNLQVGPESREKWLLALSFLVGLGFGSHLMGLLFIPAIILAWAYVIRHKRTWKPVLAQLALIFAGLLVYLYLPLTAQSYPPINWGNPQTWSGFIWEVTGSPYRSLLFNTDTPVLWERIRSIASLLMDQFGPLGLVAGVIGAVQYSFTNKYLRWILVWIFSIYFVFAIGYNTPDSAGYLIPAIMVFAIWIGLALLSIWSLSWKRAPIGSILSIALIFSIGIRIPSTRSRLDPRAQDQPAQYAEQFLRDAPSNAIVLTTTDGDTFPLWFYHFGLHQRPDLRVVVLPLTQFVWYQETLVHVYPDLAYPAIYAQDLPNANWGEQIASLNPERPVCNTQIASDSDLGVVYHCTQS